ncbi:hypothetical protein F4780DRAFT_755229 [Xylariomycetidae sp. FL0641]|nr:hypothetical protein F4780DRAFT_755229 [Xylariomycetidae sp. FL0641]
MPVFAPSCLPPAYAIHFPFLGLLHRVPSIQACRDRRAVFVPSANLVSRDFGFYPLPPPSATSMHSEDTDTRCQTIPSVPNELQPFGNPVSSSSPRGKSAADEPATSPRCLFRCKIERGRFTKETKLSYLSVRESWFASRSRGPATKVALGSPVGWFWHVCCVASCSAVLQCSHAGRRAPSNPKLPPIPIRLLGAGTASRVERLVAPPPPLYRKKPGRLGPGTTR